MQRVLKFYGTTLGKKVVMALSGLVLLGFALGHMLGNLQVFLGPEVFNAYGVGIHDTPLLLWGTRALLLTAVSAHIVSAVKLVSLSKAARPARYRVKKDSAATFASKTMFLSGIVIFFFILYHIAHFTYPGVAMGPYEHQHYSLVYTNFVNGFRVPWVTTLYVFAQIALGMHIFHGSASILQSLGINNPLRIRTWRGTAHFIAILVTVGNIVLPLSVLVGIVN